jgi:hypothetical protein
MATTTVVYRGKPKDGETSADAGSFAERINTVTTGAAGFDLAMCKRGDYVWAVIVYW